MAIQTLNTIKTWFKTSLKPSQQQFWDTWDSFRHKLDKVPVKDVEGVEELLDTKADKSVLDDHLNDKIAHAPQVNTDWNSESGFSQLLNKPDFKTINGKSLLGDGNISIEEGGQQNLDQTLSNGNTSTKEIIFESNGGSTTTYNNMGVLLRGNNSANSSLSSLGFHTVGENGLVYIENKGQITVSSFGGSTLQLESNEITHNAAGGNSTSLQFDSLVPGHFTQTIQPKSGTIALLSDISEAESPNLQQILESGNETYLEVLFKRGEDEDTYENIITPKQIEIKRSNDYVPDKNEIVSLKSNLIEIAKLNTGETTALFANGVGFGNSNTNNYSTLGMNPATTANYSNVLMPSITKEGQTKTLATTDDFKTINGLSIIGEGNITLGNNNQSGTPNKISKFDSLGTNLENSSISDNGSHILMETSTEIDSKEEGRAGLKFTNLKNESKFKSEIVFDQDVTVTVAIDDTAYFPFGNIVKKVNLDKSVTDYLSLPEGFYISRIIPSPTTEDLFLIYYDGTLYNLVKFDNTGILSILKSSYNNLYYLDIDKNNSLYVQELNSTVIFKIDSLTLKEDLYYNGNLSLRSLGFDQDLNGYFIDYDSQNIIYKINEFGLLTNFITLDFEVREGCVKSDGSLYVTSQNFEDKNIYSIDKNGTSAIIFVSGDYKLYEPCLSEDGYLYVHNNDYENGLVYRVSPLGEIIIFGSAGESPRGMKVTKSGIVYTSNSASYNLIKISLQENIKLLTLDKDGNVIFSKRDVTVKSDFKTINGESMVGDGNLEISAEVSSGAIKIADGVALDGTFRNLTDNLGNPTRLWVNTTSITSAGGDNTLSNVAFGPSSMINVSSGVENTAFGNSTLSNNTSGTQNTAIGYSALRDNTTGYYNTAIGCYSLLNNTEGRDNTALGHGAMFLNELGSENVALGYSTLTSNISGSKNIAIGYAALNSNKSSSNLAIGTRAMVNTVNGNTNTAIGEEAMQFNVDGSSNTAIGLSALKSIISSSWNVAIGLQAGRYTSKNTDNTSSNSSIFLGGGAMPLEDGTFNEIVIGTFAVGSGANTVTIGDNNITKTVLKGAVSAKSYNLTALNIAPTSSTDTGTLGEIRITANYLYVCTATNTWVRSALTTW